MKIEDYLKGTISYPISLNNIEAIILDRGVVLDLSTAVTTDVSVATLELIKADVFMFMVRSTNIGSEKQSKGDWASETGAIRITDGDRNFMISEANRIYRKYGEYNIGESNVLNLD